MIKIIKKSLFIPMFIFMCFFLASCNNSDLKCLNCGESITVEAKFCPYCGETILESSNHDKEQCSHNWETATCTSPKTCSKCGVTEGEKLAHSWKSATCTEPKTCTECGETEGNELEHTTTTGICDRCHIRQGWTKEEVQSHVKIYDVFVDKINSAGGVDMKIAWENTSSKTIKYIYFTVEAYNAVDDKVYCEIGNYNEFIGYSTGPFETGYTNLLYDNWEDEYSVDTYWENCYYNSDIRYFVLTNIRIIYMDNTEENIEKDYVDYAFTDIPQGLVYTWNDEYDGYEVNYRMKNDCMSKQISIPETYNNEKVVAIADKAFYEINTIEKIILPKTIKNIGQFAFYECTNLISVNLPDSVKEIGSYAFSGCGKLNNIDLPSNLNIIKTGSFSHCTSLVNFVIPYGVTEIELHAFFGCDKLITVIIPNTVVSVGDSAFGQCTNLEYVIIPHSVENMGRDVFSFSLNLTIYCEASSKPSGWDYSWYYRVGEVIWGYTES